MQPTNCSSVFVFFIGVCMYGGGGFYRGGGKLPPALLVSKVGAPKSETVFHHSRQTADTRYSESFIEFCVSLP